MAQINQRTHKLLVMVGIEGPTLEARDFKKLHQVIIKQYIGSNKPAFIQYFLDFFPQVIRRIPLKQHIYACLTFELAKQNNQLAVKILRSVLKYLEKDLNELNLYESINGILYLSEMMNIGILNSQCFFDIIDDIVAFIENSKNTNHRNFMVLAFCRTLHNFCYSLNKKVYFQFKKLLERAKKYCNKSVEFCTILEHFLKGTVSDGSIINRVYEGCPQLPTTQIQQSMKLTLQPSQQKKYNPIQYHIPQAQQSQKLYQEYQKNEGQLHLSNIQQILELLELSNKFMIDRLNTYINYQSEKYSFIRKYLIDILYGKALRSKNNIKECYTMIEMIKNNRDYAGFLEQTLSKGLAEVDTLDLGEELKFAEIVSYVTFNWPNKGGDMTDIGPWDWQKFTKTSQNFGGQEPTSQKQSAKKTIILKLIFSKLHLLNDAFQVPANLKKYCPSQDLRNPVKYKAVQQMQVQESFQEHLKRKLKCEQMLEHIKNQSDYQIFLQTLFEKTSQSHTHLQVLVSRYERIFLKYKQDYDWTLLNSVRSYWTKSLFHRLLYLEAIIQRDYVDFQSYVKYISKVETHSQQEALLLKIELNQLNNIFGSKLKSGA